MKNKQFYGIWIYSLLCLILVLLYKYSTDIFEPTIAEYNLSLWLPLVVNVILIVFSLLSFRESKIISILGVISTPLSIYFFYESWTRMNYEYLAGFIAIPIILLLIVMFFKPRYRKRGIERLPYEKPGLQKLPRA